MKQTIGSSEVLLGTETFLVRAGSAGKVVFAR
jgi:hypothetical protein